MISDEENIRNLDAHKGRLARLADPRGLSDAEAKRVIAQTKPVYMLTGGLHSAETGPPEMLMELAYRLAADESPLYENIRKNVIVMVNNSSDPDGLLRMYGTFGNGGANTMRRTIGAALPPPSGADVDPAGGRGGRGAGPAAREWYRPLPPPRDLVWSMRNNTNYMETGVLSALELTANFQQTVLENFYQKSRNSVKSGETEAPYGYVIPEGQRDMTRAAFIVNILRLQGIEVGRSTTEVKLQEGTFPAGSLVIKRNQPYGRLAKILLEKQNFPEGNLPTYDDTAWTMGLMNQTEIKEVADKTILDVKTQPVEKLEIAGAVKGDGPLLTVLH